MSSKPSQLVCPTEAPAYYIMTLHTIAVVSLPFNITAFYLVWFHSPKSSKYRYCLLYVQLSTFFTEIYMSWVNPGYYFFPMIGGYNTSPLRKYISTPVSMSIYVFAFCFELPSYLICFLYRHECVLELDRYFPKCEHAMLIPSFEIYDYRINIVVAYVGIGAFLFIFFTSIYIGYLTFTTRRILRKLRKRMSVTTYSMHRSSLIALSLQVLIPLFLLVIPLYTIGIVIAKDLYQYQELATNSMFIIVAHSLTSSICMIVTNPRHLRILIDKLRLGRITGRFIGARKTTFAHVSSVLNTEKMAN
ncbi:unnamed protein product [Caenorhabditis bovis]|uniref:Uncharacterized protein n=1 Tax=Caenorhabditis bovis TaxID=2654633 RepID=A0A8S1F7T4_9PELO|nr:unnamed protein product [Caenorhabditis bovis]